MGEIKISSEVSTSLSSEADAKNVIGGIDSNLVNDAKKTLNYAEQEPYFNCAAHTLLIENELCFTFLLANVSLV